MLAYYGTAISEHITKKPNGGIVCTSVPVARTGAQEYFARELQLDGDPERVIVEGKFYQSGSGTPFTAGFAV